MNLLTPKTVPNSNVLCGDLENQQMSGKTIGELVLISKVFPKSQPRDRLMGWAQVSTWTMDGDEEGNMEAQKEEKW